MQFYFSIFQVAICLVSGLFSCIVGAISRQQGKRAGKRADRRQQQQQRQRQQQQQLWHREQQQQRLLVLGGGDPNRSSTEVYSVSAGRSPEDMLY